VTGLIIWLAGVMFTLGLMDDGEKHGFKDDMFMFFVWPFILGLWLREMSEEEDK